MNHSPTAKQKRPPKNGFKKRKRLRRDRDYWETGIPVSDCAIEDMLLDLPASIDLPELPHTDTSDGVSSFGLHSVRRLNIHF